MSVVSCELESSGCTAYVNTLLTGTIRGPAISNCFIRLVVKHTWPAWWINHFSCTCCSTKEVQSQASRVSRNLTDYWTTWKLADRNERDQNPSFLVYTLMSSSFSAQTLHELQTFPSGQKHFSESNRSISSQSSGIEPSKQGRQRSVWSQEVLRCFYLLFLVPTPDPNLILHPLRPWWVLNDALYWSNSLDAILSEPQLQIFQSQLLFVISSDFSKGE